MKLLIVEDEIKTGEYLKQGLTEAGYVVDLLHNGIDGYHRAMTESYDLLILDVQRVTVLVKELIHPWLNSTPCGDDHFPPTSSSPR